MAATVPTRITDDSKNIALQYGPTVSDGIMAMQEVILNTKPPVPQTVSPKPSDEPQVNKPRDPAGASTADFEAILRKVVQTEGVMLHSRQRGFFQEFHNALIMACSRTGKTSN